MNLKFNVFSKIAKLAKLLLFGIWGEKNRNRPVINDPISEGHIVENTFISETAKGPWAP
jgi:hypothetical protein